MAAKPAVAPPPKAAKPADNGNETAIELGAGALALLALGGAALAVTRRRRRRAAEEEWYGDEAVEHEHAEPAVAAEAAREAAAAEPRHDAVADEQPAMVAPAMSAFAWGNETRHDDHVAASGDDRHPGETWVERAYRGPSPDNPSASLRKRLKRAAFFDKREADAAAGKAVPVDPDAGLPEAVTDEHELEAA